MVKDWSYIATFNHKDLPSLQEMIRQINETHNVQLLDDFNNKLEQKSKGENPSLEINGNPIQIQSTRKSDDLVTNPGLQQCINLALGINSTKWRYMDFCKGTYADPAVTDIKLGAGAQTGDVDDPIDMSAPLKGWRESVGMKLYFGGIAGELIAGPSDTSITELGVFNAINGTMLNRSKFTGNPILRSDWMVQWGDFEQDNLTSSVAVLSAVVEFCPVA